MSDSQDRPGIPRPALVLGWLGVVPFAALTIAAVADVNLPVAAFTLLVGYSVAILSFMGGAQWGLTARAQAGFDASWTTYAASVVPALLAWVALFLPLRLALPLLIAGFAGLLAYDLWTVRSGIAPRWYGSLRIQLTAAVVSLLVAACLWS